MRRIKLTFRVPSSRTMSSHKRIALHFGGGFSSFGCAFSAITHANGKVADAEVLPNITSRHFLRKQKTHFPFSTKYAKIRASTLRPSLHASPSQRAGPNGRDTMQTDELRHCLETAEQAHKLLHDWDIHDDERGRSN